MNNKDQREPIGVEQATALVENFLNTGRVPASDQDWNYFGHAIAESSLPEQAYMNLYGKIVKASGSGYLKDQIDTVNKIITKEHLKRHAPPLNLRDIKSPIQHSRMNGYFELTETIDKISNQDFLKQIVSAIPPKTEFRFSSPESYAVSKITDQDFLKSLAQEYHDFWIRDAAVDNIDDAEFLTELKPTIKPRDKDDISASNLRGAIDKRVAQLTQPATT